MTMFTPDELEQMENFKVSLNNGVGDDGEPLHNNFQYTDISATFPKDTNPNELVMGGSTQFRKIKTIRQSNFINVADLVSDFVIISDDDEAFFGEILSTALENIVGIQINDTSIDWSTNKSIDDIVFDVMNGGETVSIKLLDLIRVAGGINFVNNSTSKIRITSLANKFPKTSNLKLIFEVEENLFVAMKANKRINTSKGAKTEIVRKYISIPNPFLPLPKFDTVLSKDEILPSINSLNSALYTQIKNQNPRLSEQQLLKKLEQLILKNEDNCLLGILNYYIDNPLTKEMLCNQFIGANYNNKLNNAQKAVVRKKVFNVSTKIQTAINAFNGYCKIKPNIEANCLPEHTSFQFSVTPGANDIYTKYKLYLKTIKINDLITLKLQPPNGNDPILDSYYRTTKYINNNSNNNYYIPEFFGEDYPIIYTKTFDKTVVTVPIKYADRALAVKLNKQEPGWLLSVNGEFAFYADGSLHPMSELQEWNSNNPLAIVPIEDQYVNFAALSSLEDPLFKYEPLFPTFEYDPDGTDIGEQWVMMKDDRGH